MKKCNIIKNLKFKKILAYKSKKIVALFNIKNDFCYSVIYHPEEPWWDPLNNSSSLVPERHSSVKMEESGVIDYFSSSLQANRVIYKVVHKRENNYIWYNEIINNSEFKNLI